MMWYQFDPPVFWALLAFLLGGTGTAAFLFGFWAGLNKADSGS